MLPAPDAAPGDAAPGDAAPGDAAPGGAAPARRPPLLVVLTVLLVLEALLVSATAVWLLVELLTVRPESYAGAVAILVLAIVAAAWVFATALAAWRGRSWSRASAVTIQVVQLAVAVGCFQGLYAVPVLGWTLLIPAVAGIVLAITPQVVRATERNTEQHE